MRGSRRSCFGITIRSALAHSVQVPSNRARVALRDVASAWAHRDTPDRLR
jgi:hypothetical protein